MRNNTLHSPCHTNLLIRPSPIDVELHTEYGGEDKASAGYPPAKVDGERERERTRERVAATPKLSAEQPDGQRAQCPDDRGREEDCWRDHGADHPAG